MENTDNEQGNEQGNERLITDVKYVYDVEQLQKNEEKVQIAKLVDDTAHLKDIITKLNELIGTDPKNIGPNMEILFLGKWKKGSIPELWDGLTSQRIVNKLVEVL